MTAHPGQSHRASSAKQPQAINRFTRRGLLAGTLAGCGAGLLSPHAPAFAVHPAPQPSDKPANPGLRYCLNTSTIQGSEVPLREQLKIASQAGYDGVELWVRDITKALEEGSTAADLRAELTDLGLTLESAIAFGQWITDDDAQRQQGLEQCRQDMELIAELGGSHIAAPPTGATKTPGLNLAQAGQRYRDLLEVGRAAGVLPQIELWGFSQNLSRLEEVLYVAAAAQHADASILLDVYHLYKGGSDFQNLGLVPGHRMPCLHMNDYPATPERSAISDKDRVYPGDGVAPLDAILQTLVRGGFAGTLSLELFNREYWQQAPLDVARIGLEKMKSSVESALA